MRVMVSCAGAFHSFNLAEQLHAAGALAELATTYPARYALRRFAVDVPPDRVASSYLQVATAAVARLPLSLTDPTRWVRAAHDYWASKRVTDDLDIVVGWSGCSVRTLREANRRGRVSIVVRGSAHIQEQMAILQGAYASAGLPFAVPGQAVEQEVREYDEAAFIQTNSNFAKRTFVARGIPEHKIIMCTTGVNLGRFKPHPREDDVFRFVYAGGLTIQKGTHLLLEAFSNLRLPDAELWLLGGVTSEIQPWLRRYGGPRVRAFGHQPQDQLPRLYSQGSVFVLPSYQEGLATVQAQAMACGLPLLCTTNTGGEDFLSAPGVEGVVIPPGDVKALEATMLGFYEDRERTREMGRRARERISTGFTWKTYGAALLERYRSILASRGQPAPPPSASPTR